MHGHRFFVDERVIVPRSFIGELLQDGLQPYVADPDQVSHVLELCTGSGCLAILAAQAFQNADIDAVDISPAALEVAHRNVDDYGLAERISLSKADLFAPLPGGRYDVIVTNPPYVNATAMPNLPPEYRHEPELALAGGADGMDVVRRIVADARSVADRGRRARRRDRQRARKRRASLGGLEFVWLSTSAGDDRVVLIERRALSG